MSERASASVEVLTAEVRTLMVGSRQVTLSVYRQLDRVPPERCIPFGRVRDVKDHVGSLPSVYVVGRDRDSEALVRSYLYLRRHEMLTIPAPVKDWWERVTPGDPGAQVAVRDAIMQPGCLLGRIASDADDGVYWMLRYEGNSFTQYTTYWRFRDSEIADHAQVQGQEGLVTLREKRRLFAEWEALPLIVLAGLR